MVPIRSRIPVARQEEARRRCPKGLLGIVEGFDAPRDRDSRPTGGLPSSPAALRKASDAAGIATLRAPNRRTRQAVVWVPYVGFHPLADQRHDSCCDSGAAKKQQGRPSMLSERIEGKWIETFVEVFNLCKIGPGDTVAILSETLSREINVHLTELALIQLKARPFHVIVRARRTPGPSRSAPAAPPTSSGDCGPWSMPCQQP